MKKLLTSRILIPGLVAALVFTLTFAGSVQAQSKLGHLNFQELLASMPEAKSASQKMEAYGAELQSQYQQYLQEYETRQAEYQAGAPSWSEVKREAAEQDMQGLVQRIQEFEVTSQEKLAAKQNELMEPLITKAQAAVKAVGDELGLTYIIDSSTLLHIGAGATDVLEKAKAKL